MFMGVVGGVRNVVDPISICLLEQNIYVSMYSSVPF